jgi:drug/metabolite transporter (DMT)-like permease
VTVVALALALALLATGLRTLGRRETGQRDFVLALCLGSLVALAVAQLPVFSPYLSIKLDGYGTVPMILTALAPLEGRRLPPRRLVVGGVFAFLSLALVVFAGRFTLSAPSSLAAASALTRASSPPVRIDVRNTWQQMWALYFTRDQPAFVAHPSAYLTSMGLDRRPCAYDGAACRTESARRSPQNIEGRP